MNTIQIKTKNAHMIAHRGVSGLEKENTHSAFVAAGNRSYWGVETDIHRTADGQFIVIHDDKTDRVTGKSMAVEGTDYETLRAIPLLDIDGKAGRVDLRMPSLAEYIRICKKYEKFCVLELKNHFSEEDIGNIIDIISAEEWLTKTVFISFDFENLVSVRRFSSGQTVQFLTQSIDGALIERLKTHRFDLDIRYTALTQEWVQNLHEAGIRVNCWTVNDPDDGKRLDEWGVDYITSNILE